MSKKLIAGAGVVASLAVALAPLATFAENEPTIVDDLIVNIPEACEFGHTFTDQSLSSSNLSDVARVDGVGAWNNNNTPQAHKAANKAYGTMEAGTATDNFASNTISIFCNKNGGYHLTAAATDLNGPNSKKIEIGDGASEVEAGDSTSLWSYTLTLTHADNETAALDAADSGDSTDEIAAPDSAETILHNTATTGNAGDVLNIVYSVGIISTQQAGTYEGTITYTLYEGQE